MHYKIKGSTLCGFVFFPGYWVPGFSCFPDLLTRFDGFLQFTYFPE